MLLYGVQLNCLSIIESPIQFKMFRSNATANFATVVQCAVCNMLCAVCCEQYALYILMSALLCAFPSLPCMFFMCAVCNVLHKCPSVLGAFSSVLCVWHGHWLLVGAIRPAGETSFIQNASDDADEDEDAEFG